MPPVPAERKRRLFFALWPDDTVRGQVAALSRAVCERPVPAANLHLTLLFLGMRDEAAFECFRGAAGQVRGGPFELTLDRYGGWARKRIQWLGPSVLPAALGELAGTVVRAMGRCGLEAEERPFIPHVTLSRKAKKTVEGPVPEPVSWCVRDFVLAESVPSPEGVRYLVRGRWKL